MKTLLICPARRAAVAALADSSPLALVPVFGRCLLEYWIAERVARGARHVLVLASDRPDQVRAKLDDGTRWGVRIEVLPEIRELTAAEARAKYRASPAAGWLPAPADALLVDRLPGLPDHPLLEGYAAWFAALQAWQPHPFTPDRIGQREVRPGVWVGLHSRIDPTAQIEAPCWIGENVTIGPDAVIGPESILDDGVLVDTGARVARSVVGPQTYVGEWTSVENSFAHGDALTNWRTGSALRVPDAFLLSSLAPRPRGTESAGWSGRTLALLALVVTAPAAALAILVAACRENPVLPARLAIRPGTPSPAAAVATFTFREIAGVAGWLRRWPQLWSIVRGDLAWFGNRPLSPAAAAALANDFERLWLAAPAGFFSLADAHGCAESPSEETHAHASYYAVHAGPRLNWFILTRALFRSGPIHPGRPRRSLLRPAALSHLVQKQQS